MEAAFSPSSHQEALEEPLDSENMDGWKTVDYSCGAGKPCWGLWLQDLLSDLTISVCILLYEVASGNENVLSCCEMKTDLCIFRSSIMEVHGVMGREAIGKAFSTLSFSISFPFHSSFFILFPFFLYPSSQF